MAEEKNQREAAEKNQVTTERRFLRRKSGAVAVDEETRNGG